MKRSPLKRSPFKTTRRLRLKMRLRHSDTKFAAHIRVRDEQCAFCGKPGPLECSHFFNRRKESVRMDPENADSFCHDCHGRLETLKGEGQAYREWKIKQLGAERFEALAMRSEVTGPAWMRAA